MHTPATELMAEAAAITHKHVATGHNVCHDLDELMHHWLRGLPMGSLLSLDGFAAHIAQHCEAELARRRAAT